MNLKANEVEGLNKVLDDFLETHGIKLDYENLSITDTYKAIMELLEEINANGTTIVMVPHDPLLAPRAQRNIHIIDGQVTELDINSPFQNQDIIHNEIPVAVNA